MSESGPSGGAPDAAVASEAPSPYLHDRGTAVYNPLSGETLLKESPAYAALSRIASGEDLAAADAGILEHLRAARFLIEDAAAESRRTHLLYVSLETCTSCNHRCPFCPVSVDPRDKEVMSQELFELPRRPGRRGRRPQRRRLPVELQRADGGSALRGARAALSSSAGCRSRS